MRERAKQSKNNGSAVFVRKIHLGKQHLIMWNCYEVLSLFKVKNIASRNIMIE